MKLKLLILLSLVLMTGCTKLEMQKITGDAPCSAYAEDMMRNVPAKCIYYFYTQQQ